MELTYRRSAGKSYMVIRGEGRYPAYQLEMCRRNKLEPFLEFETVVADGQMEFWYDITGKQSLEEYIKHEKAGSQVLLCLIKAVYAAMKESENYLLQEQSIQLSPEYIFLSNSTKKVEVCYCPGIEHVFADGFRSLMEYLLAYVDHGEERAVTISYRMYQMTLEPNFGMDELQYFLQEEGQREVIYERNEHRGEYSETARTGYVENEKITEYVEEELVYDTKQERKRVLEKWMEQGKKILESSKSHFQNMRLGEKDLSRQMVFEPMGEQSRETNQRTVFLGTEEERKMVKLIYMGEECGKDVELIQDVYCVGSQDDADIVIEDETVSRLHARLNKFEGLYYIEDLNSKNGTWINGKVLHYLEKVALRNGDVIAFSDVKYRYEET